MILDGVVSASFKNFSDFCPFVLQFTVKHEQDPLFLLGPIASFDLGVEVVVPSLAALFADPVWQVLADEGPLLGADSLHQLDEHDVFLGRPRCFTGCVAVGLHHISIVAEVAEVVVLVDFLVKVLIHN